MGSKARGKGGRWSLSVMRSSTDLFISICRDASPGMVKVREVCSIFPQLIARPEKTLLLYTATGKCFVISKTTDTSANINRSSGNTAQWSCVEQLTHPPNVKMERHGSVSNLKETSPDSLKISIKELIAFFKVSYMSLQNTQTLPPKHEI